MFCKNCGAEVQDGVAFCGACGAQMEAPVAAAPQYAPVAEKNNNLVKLVAIAVAAVIVIVGIFAVFSGKGYEKVAKKYATAQAKCDYKKAFKYTAIDMEKVLKDYFEYMEDEKDEDLEELYEELEDEYDIKVKNVGDVLECAAIEAEENMFDQYGEYKVKVKVMRSKKLTARKIKNIVDGDDTIIADYEVDDYIKSDKIKKAYEVKVKVIIDGEEEYEADTITYTVVKYRGKWKVYTLSFPRF